MPKVYAFDVDHTLNIAGGPIQLMSLKWLADDGHIVGLCGNWAVVTMQAGGWQRAISFLGPLSMTKGEFLSHLANYIPAEEYVMVGNDPEHFGESQDVTAAAEAGWRFIREHDFADGQR